jgi:ketosteroid isomerase-like protein
MRISLRFVLPLGLILCSVPAAAQRRPGDVPGGAGQLGAARQEYTQAVLKEHDALMRQWMQAWAEGDSRAAARAYSAEAMVLFGPERAQGPTAVGGWLERSVGEIAEVQTALSDFRASGNLAYATGTFQYQPRAASGAAPQTVIGTYFAVLVEERGRWKYQTQVFVPDAPAGATLAPAQAVGGN